MDDGVALHSMAHPVAPWYRRLMFWLRRPRLSKHSLEDIEIEIREPRLEERLSGVAFDRIHQGILIKPWNVVDILNTSTSEEDYIRAKHTRYEVDGYDPKTDTNFLRKIVDDNEIEKELQAKGKTASRVTRADIEACIAWEYYRTGGSFARQCDLARVGPARLSQWDQRAIDCLTLCVLVLRNGFKVTGESTCVSPENFDVEFGRRIARENAIRKVWELEGYLLQQRLFEKRDFDTSAGA